MRLLPAHRMENSDRDRCWDSPGRFHPDES